MTFDLQGLIDTAQGPAIKSAVDVVRVCMEYAEKTQLPGAEKAVLVKDLLTDSRLMLSVPAQVREGVQTMLSADLLQPTIDLVCAAAKGQLDLGKTVVCCTKFLSTLAERFFHRTK